MEEKDIVYESGNFFVIKTQRGDFKVYRSGLTHATLVATVGRNLTGGSLKRAKEEADRRHAIEAYEAISGVQVKGIRVGKKRLTSKRKHTTSR